MDELSTIGAATAAGPGSRTRASAAAEAVRAKETENRSAHRTGARGDWMDRMGLALVFAISAFSLAGFAVFGRHPERLAGQPQAAAVYGWMMLLAPRVQILAAFVVLALVLTRHVRARWLTAFIALYVVSLASELAGTTVGLPFGPYHYTPALGAKWFGHVPLLIPLSWFFMALPSYAIARRRFAAGSAVLERVLVGSLLLLSWDLSLDPAMSLVTSFWVWGTGGPYYGMPLLNLAGWYATGVVLMIALAWLRADEWIARLSTPWLAAFYGANLLLPLGMSMVAGLWGAVAATGVALAACWLLTRPPTLARTHDAGR